MRPKYAIVGRKAVEASNGMRKITLDTFVDFILAGPKSSSYLCLSRGFLQSPEPRVLVSVDTLPVLASRRVTEPSAVPGWNVYERTSWTYRIATAIETPKWQTEKPQLHGAIPFCAKGGGESATVGSPAAFVSAVVDAPSQAGTTHLDTPLNP